jgi:hypothetical protein
LESRRTAPQEDTNSNHRRDSKITRMNLEQQEGTYKALCIENDCFNNVTESDIERDQSGNIYERSKKCWDCRTDADRKAIKKWRQTHR